MRGFDLRLSIRFQLLTAFGLLLIAVFGILALDEYSQSRTRNALEYLKSQSLEGMRRSMAVSDVYGVDVVDSVVKVRQGLMSWEQAGSVIERAALRVELHWRDLLLLERSVEQQQLFSQAAESRVDADRALDHLREILRARDIQALGRFADIEMFPAIDPLTTQLRHLGDLELIRAESLVREDVARLGRVSALRVFLLGLSLLTVVLVGRSILRNIYRGVESLVRLSDSLRSRELNPTPHHRPRGELGEVVDAFVEMRSDVQNYETELQATLEDNQRVQRTLQERDLFQRTLLSAARVAIFALDSHSRFTHVNPFALELLGFRSQDFIGRYASGAGRRADTPSMIDPDALVELAATIKTQLGETVEADWRALVAMAAAGWPPREITLLRSDGTKVPVLLGVSTMVSDDGELLGLVGVATDLTALKQLETDLRASEQQAQEASRAKSAFLAAMSHEIRTPMIGVTGMVEVLSHTRLDTEQRRALNVIQMSADNLLQIIGDILDFSKIEAGKLELSPETVSLRKLVTGIGYNFMDAASGKGLTLKVEIDDALGRAHIVDGTRLRQILNNFLSNSLKFTEHGGIRITVRVLESSEAEQKIELSVRDTGIGVSEQVMRRLFQPFTQAEASTSRRYGGTGLGLTICRRLAELMDGSVDMESRVNVGSTTRLQVVFARGRVEDIVGGEGIQASAEPNFHPRRLPSTAEAERERSLVLLVDDHPTNRLVLARQLALAGFACESAEDGEAGLARWREGRFALVLTDLHMPKLDGYELTQAIRAEEAALGGARTPVIAITAAAMKGESERCMEADMDDFLAKPVTIPTLLERMQRWMPHVESSRQLIPSDPDSASQRDVLPVLDASVLGEISGGSAEVERDVLIDFLAATQGDLRSMQEARGAEDAVRTGREAHKIKGASRLVGALALSAAAAEVEAAARAGSEVDIEQGVSRLMDAFERLQQRIEQRRDRAQPASH